MARMDNDPSGSEERLFRVALHALPPRFRQEYGSELEAFHRARLEEEGDSSLARISLRCRAALDLALGAAQEWGREVSRTLRRFPSRPAGHPGSPGAPGGPGGSISRPGAPGLTLTLDLLVQDLRFALRGLARTPGFTLVAVSSLALGIGIFAATFSLVQEIWLKPVPGVTGAEHVVELLVVHRGMEQDAWTYPDFADLHATDTPLSGLAGWKERNGTLTTAQGGESVRMMYVSADYFRLLGVVPTRGRDFSRAEDVGPGQHPVAIVSHDMWQDRLGSDPGILGRVLTLNQTPYTVVGVAPPDFKGHRVMQAGTEIWVPLAQDPWVAGEDPLTRDRQFQWLRVLGRLREGAAVDEANAALETVFERLAAEYPESNEGRSARAYPFGPVPASGRATSLMGTYVLFGLLGLVLLIICGNVAGMVLARSVTREREIAVRMALGSGRRRLAGLLLAEALLLAVAGGGAGLLLGVWGMGVAYALVPDVPPMAFSLEGPVLGVSLALTLVTALAVGLLPAIRFSRPDLVSSLKEDSGGGGRRAGRIHRIAASAQAGLALILLVCCGLFLRAVGVMGERDLGFAPERLLTTRIDLSQHGYASEGAAGVFLDQIRERLGALPGVESVSIADGIPLDLVGNFTSASRSDRGEEAQGQVSVEFTRVDESFFETIGTPVLQGRGFEDSDDLASEPVIVITESLATRLWPGEEAVGQQLRTTLTRDPERDFTVVGVVAEVASSRAAERWPNVFVPLRQNHGTRVMVLVRSVGDPATVSRSVQEALLDLEPGLPFPAMVTSESLVAQSTQSQKMSAAVAGALGFLALLLSAIGVYGVVAFSVTCRTREIGLRMAMGATRETVLKGIFRDAVTLALPGLVVGALLAAGAAAAFRAELLGLGPTDPVSFLAASALLFLTIVLASLVPARRASAIDPMSALKRE